MNNFFEINGKLACLANNDPSTLLTFKEFAECLQIPEERALLFKGTLFAAEAHFGQKRNQNEQIPYIVHPLRVAHLLWIEGGVRNSDLLIAALLHDTLEDTEVTKEEILAHFGPNILFLVEELTEVGKLTLEEELAHAQKMSKDAKTIKLADRTHNLRDLLDHPPLVWEHQKIAGFLNRSESLFKVLQGTHPQLELCYLEALQVVSSL